MSDVKDRLEKLTPKQRALLERKLARKKAEERDRKAASAPRRSDPDKTYTMDFTLFFFSDDGTRDMQNKYKLLFEAARFADQAGFKAIWTPERHFQTFGGLYPNPAVLSAALARETKQLRLRAGSMVLPLHGPVRAAEDWSLVDNLSGGRAELSYASGWHKHDYVMQPDRYHDRREYMFRHIDTMRRLFAGETLELPGVDGELTAITTYPRPIQKELPYWVSCNSPTTWVRTGEMGGNVLTGIITTTDDVARYIKNYRAARANHGHDPRKGLVSCMVHTYLDEDNEATMAKVYKPLANYLKNFLDQFRMFAADQVDQAVGDEEALLKFAVERYYNFSSLLGDTEKCAETIKHLAHIGVNEVACLVDFGLPYDEVMASLERLDQLRKRFAKPEQEAAPVAAGS
jgi:natural product biosynthesis luciferase-like monooxygenase protein